MSHALLSPSSATRWLACTPSARLEQRFPDRSSGAAAEGTLAHALADLALSKMAGSISLLQYTDRVRPLLTSKYYCEEMRDHVAAFVLFIQERYSAAQAITEDARLFTETRLDLTQWVPEGFGTGDVIIIADGVLEIIDLKYGKGVPVDAFENKQMMLYALGAYYLYSLSFGIEQVRMTIYQPRLDSVTTYELTTDELLHWADETLTPRAAMAFKGEGVFQPGAHCRFCKAAGVCKANADFNLETVRHDFADHTTLSDEEISQILQRADLFTKWLSAVTEHAYAAALDGKQWPDMKLVEGRSNRKIADELRAAEALKAAGVAEAEYLQPAKLETITALEKNIGKIRFAEILSGLILKPEGAPTLVPASDKRPAFNSVASAAADFS